MPEDLKAFVSIRLSQNEAKTLVGPDNVGDIKLTLFDGPFKNPVVLHEKDIDAAMATVRRFRNSLLMEFRATIQRATCVTFNVEPEDTKSL